MHDFDKDYILLETFYNYSENHLDDRHEYTSK